jgi:hypothetical protein
MDNKRILDRRLQILAWGVIFILLGSLEIIPGDQSGWFLLGVGACLLLVNLVRYLQGVPIPPFSVAIGLLSGILGALDLANTAFGLDLHLSVSFFALVMLGIGLYLLLPGRKFDTEEPAA